MARPGRVALAAAALLLLLAPSVLPAAAAQDCPYPLGDFITRGDFNSYPTGSDDPEYQIVDAVRVRPQASFGQIVYDGTTLHFVYESDRDYLPPNSTVESEAHVIAYKEYSQATGWNVTRQWVSSEDPSVEVPPGRHVQPTVALSGGELWVAWQASGWTIGGEWWPQVGTYIVYRVKSAGAWGPIHAVSPLVNDTSNRLPKAVPLPAGGAYVAYQTNAGEADTTSFHLVGQTVNGTGVGPIEDISPAGDIYSDETVQLLSVGDRVVAVWSARNTTEYAGEGEWQVWAAQRSAAGLWSEPVAVSERSKLANINPSAALFQGGVYVAWSTNDPAVSPGGDRSIVMRKVDLQTRAVGGVIEVTNASQAGYENQPVMIEWEGEMQILWNSGSSLDTPGVVSNNTNTHWRSWDGATMSPIVSISPSEGDLFGEFNPAFLVVGDSLHATFIMDVKPPGSPLEHDQRQMTRLLFPGLRASERYEAEFEPLANVTTSMSEVQVEVRFRLVGGPGVPPDDHFGLLLANGTWVPINRGTASSVFLPVTGGVIEAPANGTWCGKMVPVTGLAPPPAAPAWLVPAALAMVAVVALGLALYLRTRGGGGVGGGGGGEEGASGRSE